MTEDRQEPLNLKGAPGSPYTRKMLAVLRYRRIPYRLHIFPRGDHGPFPAPKVELLPTFYLPNAAGQLEAVTDSTPLIRRFEREHSGRSVLPNTAALRFLDELIEDYADEWLTKAMFHYRWHYPADIDKSGNILPRWRGITASDETAARLKQQFSERQISRLRFVGSSPLTASVIEASYLRFLDSFESHLRILPYLFGQRPAAADFGLYGQLTQLAHFDPTPAALTLARAPRVYAWVGLTDELSGLNVDDSQWLSLAALPPTLHAILREIGRVYVPVMLANARALKRGVTEVQTTVDGQPWTQQPFPYQAKCVQWLRTSFHGLANEERVAVRQILESANCWPLVDAEI